jgi:hypothetical protein
MLIPPPITPKSLRSSLRGAGRDVSLRTLRSWRTVGLLPPLQTRGKGRGRGKSHFWRSPGLFEQAITICELLARKYPNDEARLVIWWLGFPVAVQKVRTAWLSRLGKMDMNLRSKITKAARKRGEPFSDLEDEISEIVKAHVINLARQFGFDRELLFQPVIDLFGFVFKNGYLPDISLMDELLKLVAARGFSVNPNPELSGRDFEQLTKFIHAYMTL